MEHTHLPNRLSPLATGTCRSAKRPRVEIDTDVEEEHHEVRHNNETYRVQHIRDEEGMEDDRMPVRPECLEAADEVIHWTTSDSVESKAQAEKSLFSLLPNGWMVLGSGFGELIFVDPTRKSIKAKFPSGRWLEAGPTKDFQFKASVLQVKALKDEKVMVVSASRIHHEEMDVNVFVAENATNKRWHLTGHYQLRPAGTFRPWEEDFMECFAPMAISEDMRPVAGVPEVEITIVEFETLDAVTYNVRGRELRRHTLFSGIELRDFGEERCIVNPNIIATPRGVDAAAPSCHSDTTTQEPRLLVAHRRPYEDDAGENEACVRCYDYFSGKLIWEYTLVPPMDSDVRETWDPLLSLDMSSRRVAMGMEYDIRLLSLDTGKCLKVVNHPFHGLSSLHWTVGATELLAVHNSKSISISSICMHDVSASVQERMMCVKRPDRTSMATLETLKLEKGCPKCDGRGTGWSTAYDTRRRWCQALNLGYDLGAHVQVMEQGIPFIDAYAYPYLGVHFTWAETTHQ
ncbi:hypothetical protein CYMTET_54658 [Cymbomonas tetramitiformis]|uniref:Uncharacterized protein n=1 Tax=Cymbomonas tetramitiformis TaxID=36881 RepID=A0AAE0BFP0_9CHLO|nr:hypothetical protein CYMTET_54658 [Cymbomonas tetramitiformis]